MNKISFFPKKILNTMKADKDKKGAKNAWYK